MKDGIERIFQILECEPFKVFPMQYKADVCLEEGKVIAGFLKPREFCDTK